MNIAIAVFSGFEIVLFLMLDSHDVIVWVDFIVWIAFSVEEN